MSETTELERAIGRLEGLTMGPKGGRPDYVGTLSGADALEILNEIARLRALESTVIDARPAINWAAAHYIGNASICAQSPEFAPIADSFKLAAHMMQNVVRKIEDRVGR